MRGTSDLLVVGERPPSYPSKKRLAAELDMSESTVDDYVARGILPKPYRLTNGCVRWCWAEVQTALASLAGTAETAPDDPYMQGARNVARKAREGGRDAA